MPRKENIWDLVSARSYHSCLITTYSFDFYYFEKSVMRILRSKGIGNISVFIDNNIFQGILGKVGSSNSKIYSISPINSNGCFHPKLYMFFGEKQGLLIIGSGNLTSSGHGKNDEIWGAFNFDATDPKYNQLFANSWTFFEKVSQNLKGFTKEKIRWIKEYTPWIEKLPKPKLTSFETLDNSTSIAFLYNNLQTSIFQQLSELVPFNKVKELTIIAPYFDSKGKIIELFSKVLTKAIINVLIDDKYGILPFGLSPRVANQVNFYHWKDCIFNKDEDKVHSRLHAKLFNFSLTDNSQLCLLGSANASIAALGTESFLAINEEVSILLNSSNQDFLKNLNIKINPEKAQNLIDFAEGLDESTVFKKAIVHEYHIEAIDKEGDVLNVYVDNNLQSDVFICVFNNLGEEIYRGRLAKKNNYYVIKIPSNLSYIMYGCLKDPETAQIISNKQIIQDIYILAKTNPDPQRQILDVLFSGIEQGDELLFSKLIDCISIEDFSSENKSFLKKVNVKKPYEGKESINVKGKVLDYEEFKDVSYDSIHHQYFVLNSSSNRIADFLSSLSSLKSREETTSAELDDEELDLKLNYTHGRKDGQTESNRVTKSSFSNEKSRIIKFFERYDQYLENEVDKLILKSNKNEEENKVSITELSNLVIALYIAIYYTDNNRQYVIGEETHHDKIIRSYGFKNYDNLAVINSDVVGKFLLLCTKGFKTYESDYLNERLEKLKIEAFYHCLFCLSLAKWSGTNVLYRDLLLINSIHYLLNENECLLIRQNIVKEMNSRLKFSAFQHLTFLSDVTSLIDNFLPKYLLFAENLKLQVDKRKKIASKDLMKGNIIFTSHLGFCTIFNKQLQNEGAILILSRPGLIWDEKEEDYLLREKREYKANILFC